MLKVYDFWAEWCGPCKVMNPVIEELKLEYNIPGSNVEIIKVNVDDHPEKASVHGIRSIPTLVFERDGVTVNRLSGIKSKSQIIETINQLTK